VSDSARCSLRDTVCALRSAPPIWSPVVQWSGPLLVPCGPMVQIPKWSNGPDPIRRAMRSAPPIWSPVVQWSGPIVVPCGPMVQVPKWSNGPDPIRRAMRSALCASYIGCPSNWAVRRRSLLTVWWHSRRRVKIVQNLASSKKLMTSHILAPRLRASMM